MILQIWVLFCVQLRRGRPLPQCPVTRFSKPDRRSDCLLHDLQPDGFSEGLVKCYPASQAWLPFYVSGFCPIDAFQFRPTPLPESPSFLDSLYSIVLAWSLTVVSLARMVIPLLAAAKFSCTLHLLGPFITCRRRPTTRCRSRCRFCSAPGVFTAASSSGTS